MPSKSTIVIGKHTLNFLKYNPSKNHAYKIYIMIKLEAGMQLEMLNYMIM